ncbi:MAG: hypothetical protein ABIQ84_10285, partial [Usitatibacter sp.]
LVEPTGHMNRDGIGKMPGGDVHRVLVMGPDVALLCHSHRSGQNPKYPAAQTVDFDGLGGHSMPSLEIRPMRQVDLGVVTFQPDLALFAKRHGVRANTRPGSARRGKIGGHSLCSRKYPSFSCAARSE